MIDTLLNIFCELAPWLLLGALAAGLLHVLMPADWFRRHLCGRAGVLKSVAIGVPLPLCSCGVIPVGLGLRKDGASDGATVGFLISTPQTGVDSVLVSASFLGLPFALFKVATAMITGLVGGFLADTVSDREATEPVATNESSTPAARGFRAGLDHSVSLIRSIYVWILVGVVASTLITQFVPEESLAESGGLAGMLIALLISLPLYVCATASVPIAAALVASGLPAGAALVFLMAGPATNVATLGAVYRTLGWRNLTVYLGTIVGGSLVAGLAFEWLLAADAAGAAVHEHSLPWWSLLSAGLLALLMLWFLVDDLRRWRRRSQLRNTGTDVTVLPVEGMTCDGCAARLERDLTAMSDIDSATVSFRDHSASIQSSLPVEALSERIHRSGFTVTTAPAQPQSTDNV